MSRLRTYVSGHPLLRRSVPESASQDVRPQAFERDSERVDSVILDRTKLYIFMRRDASGAESIGIRAWTAKGWRTLRHPTRTVRDFGEWRVLLSAKPIWRRGPRMVLEVPA